MPDAPKPTRTVERRRRRHTIILTAAGVLVGIIILAVVSNLDRADDAALRPDVRGMTGTGAGSAADTPATTTSRGWIQITDETGRLAQQYRCTHLEPNPDGRGAGWIRMQQPEIEVHLSGGTLVAMRSAHALVHAPNNSVESGELSGDVIIHIYEGTDAPGFSTDRVPPTTRIRTSSAEFNSLLGTVVCPGDIRIETQRGEFDGHHLRLWLSDSDTAISNLIVEKVHHIRIARGASQSAPIAQRPTASGTARLAARRQDAEDRPRTGARDTERSDRPSRSEPWYRLRLHRDVRVTSGEGTEGEQRVLGEELTILFTLQSRSISEERGAAPGATAASAGARMHVPPQPLAQRMIELLFASLSVTDGESKVSTTNAPGESAAPRSITFADAVLAPPPSPADIMIRCAGTLVIRPADAHLDVPESPEAAVLEITGQPVRLEAPRDDATASASRLRYHTDDGRIELDSDEQDEPVRAQHPQFRIECRHLWLASESGTGRLYGPGSMRFLRSGTESEEQSELEEGDLVIVHWNDTVDLRFAEADEGERGANLRALRRAAFRGGAEVISMGGADNIDLFGSGASEVASLTGRDIDVDFIDDGTGRPALREIAANRDVLVESERRSLRADTFRATLPARDAHSEDRDRGDDEPGIERVVASGAVQLTLPGGEQVFADALDVDGIRRTAILTGQDVRLLDDRNLIDQAQRIVVDDANGTYRIVGRGRFWRFTEDSAVNPLSGELSTLPGSRQEELRITWTDGVLAAPATDAAGAAVRLVTFSGNVRVLTPDLRIDGIDELIARLREDEREDAPDDGGAGDGEERRSAAIDQIIARGAVDARMISGEGRVRARELEIDLSAEETPANAANSGAGDLRPRRLIARGDVIASDEQSSVACRELDVFFADLQQHSGDDARSAEQARSGEPLRAAIDRATALGDVRVRLSGGELVFADRLHIEAEAEAAEVTGDPLLVLSPQFILDRGKTLHVNRSTGAYSVDGPGRMIAFIDPMNVGFLAADADAQSVREQALLLPRALEAEWTSGVDVQTADPQNGRMELRGDVSVLSDTAQREQNMLRGERVVIDFHQSHEPNDDAVIASGMQLRRLHATDRAQIENRLWTLDDRSDTPRVVSIRGGDLAFNQETFELDAQGPGELLVRAAADDKDPAPPKAGFGSGGTTLFRWQRDMSLRRIVDEQFAVSMHGEVECLHQDAEGTTSTLTARTIEATVVRTADVDGAEATDIASPEPRTGFDPGGSMTLRRLQGEGAVFVRTPRRDVTCDHFDYNLATNIAVLTARPGRAPVSVLTEGVTQPVTAERVVWNLRDDTVIISRGGGGN